MYTIFKNKKEAICIEGKLKDSALILNNKYPKFNKVSVIQFKNWKDALGYMGNLKIKNKKFIDKDGLSMGGFTSFNFISLWDNTSWQDYLIVPVEQNN